MSSLDSPRRRILKQHYWGRLQTIETVEKGNDSNALQEPGVEKTKRMMPWVDWEAIEICERETGQNCRHTHLKDVEVEELDEKEVARCKEEY